MGGSREQRAVALFGDLVRVVHAIGQAGARELRGYGFSPAQYQVLVWVATHPDCTQQQLGEQLGVTKGNVSMLVTKLDDAGLVVRRASGAAYGVRLSESGRTTLAELRPQHARFLAGCFADLDDDQLEKLAELVAALDPST